LTINGETLEAMILDDACRYLGYWGTGSGDMRATKKMVRQKIIAARDLIKCHPLTPALATEVFTSKGMGVFRFSAALIEWSESEWNDVERFNNGVSKPTRTLGTCNSQKQVLSLSSRKHTQGCGWEKQPCERAFPL